MVEVASNLGRHLGLKPGSSEISIPDRRLVTSRDVMEKFGFDFGIKAHGKLRDHGIMVNMQELQFLETPKMHKGSQALYFLEQKVGNHRIYVSYIPENGKSTEHTHDPIYKPKISEIYAPIGGILGLLVDGKQYEISEANGSFIVDPGHFHQVQQGNNASINVIILQNSAGIPDEEVHIPRSK